MFDVEGGFGGRGSQGCGKVRFACLQVDDQAEGLTAADSVVTGENLNAAC